MISYQKPAIIQKKEINVLNRVDAEFFDPDFTSLERKLNRLPNFQLGEIVKFRGIKGDSKRRCNPKKKPDEDFYYIEISNVSQKDGSIFPEKLKGEGSSPRARKIVKTNDIITQL